MEGGSKDLRNDKNTEVLPLVQDLFANEETFKKLQEVQDQAELTNNYYNYILKCTDGIFLGKFLYINTTCDGELFGSGNPDELELTMYIESANLSEIHAEIKFVDNCRYMLRDCNSETGTWIRVGRPSAVTEGCLSGHRGSGIDLYQESRLRMYRAGEYQFVIEEHPTNFFDEVKAWLRANYFPSCIPYFEQKKIESLQQMVQQIQRIDLQSAGLDEKETDRFMNLIDLIKRSTKISFQSTSAPKKQLVMRFVSGMDKQIVLDPEEMPLVFGKADKNLQQVGQKSDLIELEGQKICSQHFEVDYDKIKGTIMLRNLNLNTEQSCGLYKMLTESEAHNLQPGDAFRIGTLEFVIERFNNGIVCDIGHRENNEDAYQYIPQLLNLDNKVQITYYAVFDGHGGASCADFLAENLHVEIKSQLEDVLTGIENSDDLNRSVSDCIRRAFKIADEKYAQYYPVHSKQCGSTAIVVLMIGNKLYCANLGDARGVMSRSNQAVDLSVDHKARRPDELERIRSHGGYIVQGRVLGRLAISRAFGDYDCKNIEVNVNQESGGSGEKVVRNFILNEPEIRVVDINPLTDDFFFIASDGLFDRYNSKECVRLFRRKLSKMGVMEQDTRKAVLEVVEQAKNKRMMTDNITVILVALNRGIQTASNQKNLEQEFQIVNV